MRCALRGGEVLCMHLRDSLSEGRGGGGVQGRGRPREKAVCQVGG